MLTLLLEVCNKSNVLVARVRGFASPVIEIAWHHCARSCPYVCLYCSCKLALHTLGGLLYDVAYFIVVVTIKAVFGRKEQNLTAKFACRTEFGGVLNCDIN